MIGLGSGGMVGRILRLGDCGDGLKDSEGYLWRKDGFWYLGSGRGEGSS